MIANADKKIRCAIYTRKSTEEGLEQDFNSLDAQREAAEAYIASQKSEGWVCLSTHYGFVGYVIAVAFGGVGGVLYLSVVFILNRNDGAGEMSVGEEDAAFLIGLQFGVLKVETGRQFVDDFNPAPGHDSFANRSHCNVFGAVD